MPWNTPTVDEVLEEMLPAEATMMTATAGDRGSNILTRAVQECRGAIMGGGYALGPDGTIPDGLRSDVLAIARWRWLVAFPSLSKMQTKERQVAYDDARKRMVAITKQDYSPEPVTPGVNPASGSWNSENKLISRTHPTPRPSSQYQSTDSTALPYANPTGPSDT